ncbi:unnamed protein product [Heligmosomoides polygyrus]|uniref:EB domain-containing protein n=1 Tax=Heligmosomoides polygyrus TaxID=6339 RepID=A0A183G002_HELPZ|nr:unnamed protein product [Heligmosomoides polygyrus]
MGASDRCYAGACQCAQPAVVYSPVVGCAPPPPPPPPPMLPVPMMPAPVVVGRLIPQALPGSPCEPGVECTGGSVCSLGICLCPPELVQEGTVCVTRTIYVAPPPPPPILMPMPVAQIPLGAPCYAAVAAAPPCVPGALCSAGVCQCSPAYHPTPGGCVLRK